MRQPQSHVDWGLNHITVDLRVFCFGFGFYFYFKMRTESETLASLPKQNHPRAPVKVSPFISLNLFPVSRFPGVHVRGERRSADSRPDRSTGPISHGSGPENIAIATPCDRKALRTMDLPRNAPEVLQRRAYPALKRREFLEETCQWYTPSWVSYVFLNLPTL